MQSATILLLLFIPINTLTYKVNPSLLFVQFIFLFIDLGHGIYQSFISAGVYKYIDSLLFKIV